MLTNHDKLGQGLKLFSVRKTLPKGRLPRDGPWGELTNRYIATVTHHIQTVLCYTIQNRTNYKLYLC